MRNRRKYLLRQSAFCGRCDSLIGRHDQRVAPSRPYVGSRNSNLTTKFYKGAKSSWNGIWDSSRPTMNMLVMVATREWDK